jgi:hypothetical protein
MIFHHDPDPRLITVRRGGSLTDEHHRLLAQWAATCAAHVLHHFSLAQPNDDRPRQAIDAAMDWALGGARGVMEVRALGGHAMASARLLRGAPRAAAYAAGQAACVAHVAAHDLGAAAYAIRAVQQAAGIAAGRAECAWQRAQLADAVRAIVLSDQVRRNSVCWSVFVE